MKNRWHGDAKVYVGLKYLPGNSSERMCAYDATKWSCGECLIVCAKPKSQPYHSVTTAKKKKKTVLFSAGEAYKYLDSCPHCQTVGGSKGRFRGSKCFIWTLVGISSRFSDWGVSGTSYLWAGGFHLPSACYSMSAYCAPGFLFRLLLGESCWCEVMSLTSTSKPAVQHVQVVSPHHVHIKFKLKGHFISL